MPKYDYVCDKCGKSFEIELSYNNDQKVRCPNCKSKKVRKKITVIPFVKYVGDGFTLSRKKPKSD